MPGDHYQRLIAATFGTTRFALFPTPRPHRTPPRETTSDVDTMDLLARIRGSDVDNATLDALQIMVDRLCSAYAHTPSAQLLADARHCLAQVSDLRHRRLTLRQHREGLTLAGWLALAATVLAATSIERSPMRVAEARVTLGVAATRAGDLERSVDEGRRALTDGTKRSPPSLRMAAGELAATLQNRYRGEPRAQAYVDEVEALGS